MDGALPRHLEHNWNPIAVCKTIKLGLIDNIQVIKMGINV